MSLWTWVRAFLGLANNTTVHNVGNLSEVRAGLWRSAQPVTDADWAYLKSLGINKVVKLNFELEGSDAGADKQNIHVFTLSIQPEGDQDVWDDVKDVFVQPNRQALIAAVALCRTSPGVLVHCSHGHDRTGLVIGLNRVINDGWTKDAAYEEMLEMGFHPELHGLHEFWEQFSGQL
jgi:protein tyrosine/serine phosphatase